MSRTINRSRKEATQPHSFRFGFLYATAVFSMSLWWAGNEALILLRDTENTEVAQSARRAKPFLTTAGRAESWLESRVKPLVVGYIHYWWLATRRAHTVVGWEDNTRANQSRCRLTIHQSRGGEWNSDHLSSCAIARPDKEIPVRLKPDFVLVLWKESETSVLGPQASPPARVARNADQMRNCCQARSLR